MKPDGAQRLEIVPISFRDANAFVAEKHRHTRPETGTKFAIGVVGEDGFMHGVALAGRPKARHWDDGRTLEVNRTCTDGEPNANSCLYGGCWRAGRGMGYLRICTYTEDGETGASLRAADWVRIGERRARGSWADSTGDHPDARMRHPVGSGGVARTAWGFPRDRWAEYLLEDAA